MGIRVHMGGLGHRVQVSALQASPVVRLDASMGRPGARGPRGPEGPSTGARIAAAVGRAALMPVQRAVVAGSLTVMFMGDSDAEGTGVDFRSQRFQDMLTEALRAQFPTTGGDTGPGYTPAFYGRFWGNFADAGISRVGSESGAEQVTYSGGLGNRSEKWGGSAGQGVRYAGRPTRYLRVHYTTDEDPGYAGVIQVKQGGTVLGTIDTKTAAGTGRHSRCTDYDLGSVSSPVIDVTKVSGTPHFEGITRRTSLTGVTGIDASLSGAKASDYDTDGKDNVGATWSDDLHWEATDLYDPALGIVALGRNDQSTNDPEGWGRHVRDLAEAWFERHPASGLVFLVAPQRVSDRVTDPDRIGEYEEAARVALDGFPATSIMYESALWAPRPGFDYEDTTTDPDGWLSDISGGQLDLTHKGPGGHLAVARYLLGFLTQGVPAASSGGGAVSGAGRPTRTDLAVGTHYFDTARTAGASVWVYNGTAWEVVKANTGRRDFATWQTGWTPDTSQTYVQRDGNVVTMFIGTTNTATGNGLVCRLPAWAYPDSNFAMKWPMGELVSIQGDGWLYGWVTTASASVNRYHTATWITSRPWPTAF